MSDVYGRGDATELPSSPPESRYPPPPPPGSWPYQGAGVPPGGAAGPPPLADYGIRLGGWLIDWVLLAAVSIVVLLVTNSVHTYHTVLSSNGQFVHQSGFNIGPGGIALQAVVVIIYGAILCGLPRGQTVGMMMVGTRVIDERLGGPIGFPRAFGRAAFEYLLAVFLFFPWVIDMLFPLWDPKRQTLHDKVTRSVVVKI